MLVFSLLSLIVTILAIFEGLATRYSHYSTLSLLPNPIVGSCPPLTRCFPYCCIRGITGFLGDSLAIN